MTTSPSSMLTSSRSQTSWCVSEFFEMGTLCLPVPYLLMLMLLLLLLPVVVSFALPDAGQQEVQTFHRSSSL